MNGFSMSLQTSLSRKTLAVKAANIHICILNSEGSNMRQGN